MTRAERTRQRRRHTAMEKRLRLRDTFFCFLLLFVAFSPSTSAAETRSLKLYHVHTGEKLEIVFKRGGRFDRAGLRKINLMLRDWRRNEPTTINPRLVDLLWAVYQETGATGYINVLGGFRSPTTNEMLRRRSTQSGVAERSQHILGNAIDFYIPGVPLKTIREAALKMQAGGVGYYPTSGSPFVHIDVGMARMWPRMNREELAAIFPNGDSVYLPRDGKPLPGYGEALASYNARYQSGDTATDPQTAKTGWSLASLLRRGIRPNTGGPHDLISNDSTSRPSANTAAPQDLRSGGFVVAMPQERPVFPLDEPLGVEAFAAEAGAGRVPLPAVRPTSQDIVREPPEAQWADPNSIVAIPIPLSRPVIRVATASLFSGGGLRSLDRQINERATPTVKSSRLRAVDSSKSPAYAAVPFDVRRADWAFRIPSKITSNLGAKTTLSGIFVHLGLKPNVILAEGFRQDHESRAVERFRGSALDFLPIRRFTSQ